MIKTKSGLVWLQRNPDCAVELDVSNRFYGWMFVKGADDQWVTNRRLPEEELAVAVEQAKQQIVKHGRRLRAG